MVRATGQLQRWEENWVRLEGCGASSGRCGPAKQEHCCGPSRVSFTPLASCGKEKGYRRDTHPYCLFLKDGNGRQSLLLLKLLSSELAGEHAPTLAGRAGI